MAKTRHAISWRRIWYLPVITLSLALLLGSAVHTARAGVVLFTVSVGSSPMVDGPILTDQRGMTLYVYEFDTPGVSNCRGICASAYTPLEPPTLGGTPSAGMQSAAAAVLAQPFQPSDGMPTLDPVAGGSLSLITRDSPSGTQIAYNDMPLYLYSGDSNPGDANGQGFVGSANVAWSVARPVASSPTPTAAGSP